MLHAIPSFLPPTFLSTLAVLSVAIPKPRQIHTSIYKTETNQQQFLAMLLQGVSQVNVPGLKMSKSKAKWTALDKAYPIRP